MKFGEALELVKDGSNVCRKGWNGKGMYIVATSLLTPNGVKVNNKCLLLKNVDDNFNTWVPSITDLMAEDWEIAK